MDLKEKLAKAEAILQAADEALNEVLDADTIAALKKMKELNLKPGQCTAQQIIDAVASQVDLNIITKEHITTALSADNAKEILGFINGMNERVKNIGTTVGGIFGTIATFAL